MNFQSFLPLNNIVSAVRSAVKMRYQCRCRLFMLLLSCHLFCLTTGNHETSLSDGDLIQQEFVTGEEPPIDPVNVYTVKGEDNRLCIRMQLRGSISVPYTSTSGEMKHYSQKLERTNTTEGECQSTVSYINITLHNDWVLSCTFTLVDKDDNYVTGKFSKMNLPEFYSTSSIRLTYYVNPEIVPDTNHTVARTVETHVENKRFVARVNNYYACDSVSELQIEDVTVYMSDLKIQAFTDEDLSGFVGEAIHCLVDTPFNVTVPIAVALALLVLVGIVMASFIVAKCYQKRRPKIPYDGLATEVAA